MRGSLHCALRAPVGMTDSFAGMMDSFAGMMDSFAGMTASKGLEVNLKYRSVRQWERRLESIWERRTAA
jgi:hypothetical protein